MKNYLLTIIFATASLFAFAQHDKGIKVFVDYHSPMSDIAHVYKPGIGARILYTHDYKNLVFDIGVGTYSLSPEKDIYYYEPTENNIESANYENYKTNSLLVGMVFPVYQKNELNFRLGYEMAIDFVSYKYEGYILRISYTTFYINHTPYLWIEI